MRIRSLGGARGFRQFRKLGGGVPSYRQGRLKNRTDTPGDAIYQARNMLPGSLANAVIMFPKEVNAKNGKLWKIWWELHYSGEDHLEMENQVGN